MALAHQWWGEAGVPRGVDITLKGLEDHLLPDGGSTTSGPRRKSLLPRPERRLDREVLCGATKDRRPHPARKDGELLPAHLFRRSAARILHGLLVGTLLVGRRRRAGDHRRTGRRRPQQAPGGSSSRAHRDGDDYFAIYARDVLPRRCQTTAAAGQLREGRPQHPRASRAVRLVVFRRSPGGGARDTFVGEWSADRIGASRSAARAAGGECRGGKPGRRRRGARELYVRPPFERTLPSILRPASSALPRFGPPKPTPQQSPGPADPLAGDAGLAVDEKRPGGTGGTRGRRAENRRLCRRRTAIRSRPAAHEGRDRGVPLRRGDHDAAPGIELRHRGGRSGAAGCRNPPHSAVNLWTAGKSFDASPAPLRYAAVIAPDGHHRRRSSATSSRRTSGVSGEIERQAVRRRLRPGDSEVAARSGVGEGEGGGENRGHARRN